MTRKRPGLGKGLDALIPVDNNIYANSTSGAKEIAVEKIAPNPRQPRNQFDPDSLTELAASIGEQGVIQPLIVTQGIKEGEYTLIAGERRLEASKQIGLETVPVIVREASDQDHLELALIENVQRSDLSPLETAKAYQQLNIDFGLSHVEIAKRVGKSRTAVTNTLRLLNLSLNVQQAIHGGKISEGHARALLGLSTPQSQDAALSTVLEKELNVRQSENLVRKLVGEKSKVIPKAEILPEILALEERLQSSLGTKVRLRHGVKGGTITIHYYSNEELDGLLGKFLDDVEYT